jgi:hypothetical protein
VSVADLVHLHLETASLQEAQVHAQQHVGPVGRVHPTGARVHAEDGRPVVVLTEEEAFLLQLGQLALDRRQLGGGVGGSLGIGLLLGQPEQGLGIVDGGGEALDPIHHGLVTSQAPGDLPGPVGILPEIRFGGARPQGLEAGGLGIDVKGTSGRRGGGCATP